MFVHAFVPAVGTGPEPAVFTIFDGFDEELAHFVRRRFRVAVFTQHHLPQLLLVPVLHAILPFGLLVRFSSVLV